MNSDSDTIAAVATGPGEAGISIVRISGPQSLDIADRVIMCKAPPPSQRPAGSFAHGFARKDEQDVDEVIVLIYRAPHSYTREDVVELQGHGGRMSSQRLLRIVLNAGARLAEPGEFTKRAFLNGRIDLLQAEAVADLIQARSDRAAQSAVEQLEGALSARVTKLYDCVIGIATDIEATLDFLDDELPEATTDDIGERLANAISEAEDSAGDMGGRSFASGRRLSCNFGKAECWQIYASEYSAGKRPCNCCRYAGHYTGYYRGTADSRRYASKAR